MRDSLGSRSLTGTHQGWWVGKHEVRKQQLYDYNNYIAKVGYIHHLSKNMYKSGSHEDCHEDVQYIWRIVHPDKSKVAYVSRI